MSSLFSFEFNNCSDYKVNKRTKNYKLLKEEFPDCDFIFTLTKQYSIYNNFYRNEGEKYQDVLRFLAKGINQLGTLIDEEPFDDEIYELVYKLTGGKWEINMTCYKTYDQDAYRASAYGKIKPDGIEWDVEAQEDDG